ncbi:major Facilitator Superfamily Transporter 16 isoform X5 [Leptinotarsa decemlineata]|uniref:major Facilitator Superfamily Transporter 16 isoform X5 n=1 Tax=Leptinotarsa decemlineata TaxID=7539 RepID=UPI000C251CD3|nr:glucose-6-phosphate exchanger SLC37A2 isoform X5 [Leptinotarsa decemlineata]
MVCDNGHTRIKTESSSHPPIVLRRVNMSVLFSDVPWGIKVLQKLTDKCCPRFHINRELCYRSSIVFLTYIAYMCYHLSRKPISVVKAVLHRNCSDLTPETKDPNNSCDWAPFDGSDASASQMLGELDSSFLFCYAIAMFVSGFVAERVNLRYFLSLGMLMSGIFCYMFGLAKTYQIHSLWYYVLVQGLAGIFQTTGWPGVVTVMSNWFGKSKRGLIFGIWNSHTSIGNILGSLIAAQYVETDWALSFVMPGFYVGIVGFILFSFLVVNPADVGCATSNAGHEDRTEVQRRVTERTTLLSNSSCGTPDKAIGFLKACCIPGVLEYSLALFFSKLVSYTFLYWLPLYVNASTTMGATLSADMSTLFDVGGIAGAIIAGVITDKSDMPASTCAFMLILAAPMMIIYERVSSVSLGLNMILLVIVGLLVNGPYALITTSVSAELGTHESLEGNSKALATVTAIIDGTGSIGAAVGPLLAGFVSNYGWKYVFLMLMISDVLALFLLIRLVKQEIYKFRNGRRSGIRLE